jgi:acetoacetyl-CoA synthetase
MPSAPQFGDLLWTPPADRVDTAAITGFRIAVEQAVGVNLPDSSALHAWSVAHAEKFWDQVWLRLGVTGERGPGPAIVAGDRLSQTSFFPGARLNMAENLLRPDLPAGDVAVVAYLESGQRRELTRGDLLDQAARFAEMLRELGVSAGDRVAAWLPNVPETVVAFLGSAMVGAVFSSASPDFGVAGVLDRFGQIAPKVLVVADGYRYNGKEFTRLDAVADVLAGLPSRPEVFVVPMLGATVPEGMRPWSDAQIPSGAAAEFEHLPFDHPLVVLYSSGTTGVPKAIVHRAGGVLLKHLVEHQLHCDIRPGDRVFYYTTCGWMMWNWQVSALASGATLVMYEGAPTYPEAGSLFDIAEAERVTFFGTSAKYLDAIHKAGVHPAREHDLSALRTVASTGSPLSPEGFGYVYDAIGADVHLASISGGTDIVGCFVLGDPTRPVHAGEIQGPALGLDVDVVDESGTSLAERPGVRGELVCRNRFPSMPVGFWGDGSGERFENAYFRSIPGMWTHGDYASTTANGGFVIHGRSDATLNAGGVRIGTAEIYRQVEALAEIAESLAIGQEWDGDTRIVLFVVPAAGYELTEELAATIKQVLRERCSPRHVPARIVAVPDLPRTRSGKLAELAVRDVVHGRTVGNENALANPESLAHFRARPELAS